MGLRNSYFCQGCQEIHEPGKHTKNPVLLGEAEKKVELPLDTIQYEASGHLSRIKELFPAQYKITMVARNTDTDNADIVLTEDPDMEAVKQAIDNSKVKRNGARQG